MAQHLNSILILFVHPKLERSRAHKFLLEAIPDRPGITVNDLYEKYPEFDIDTEAEQALLAAHDVVIWQYPLYWYSYPPLLKEWIDMVLRAGWAYGPNGTALRGKYLFDAITMGGQRADYCRSGRHHFTVREFLAPQEQTARFCNMVYLPPFAIHDTAGLTDQALWASAQQYGQLLEYLMDHPLPVEDWDAIPYLNDWFSLKQAPS